MVVYIKNGAYLLHQPTTEKKEIGLFVMTCGLHRKFLKWWFFFWYNFALDHDLSVFSELALVNLGIEI